MPPFALLTVMIMLRFSNLSEVNQVAKSQQQTLTVACLSLPTARIFLGVVSASSARRKFWRWREQYRLVRERLAKTFNAAIGVLTASKNGGYALI
jgi:hypothetical protein